MLTRSPNQATSCNAVSPQATTIFDNEILHPNPSNNAWTSHSIDVSHTGDRQAIDISVVLPVYKSADCIEELYNRLTLVVSQLAKNYELIFVDDGSPDSSWQQIQALSARDRRVKGVKLSRNFGQHAAISAGLKVSCGSSVVVMDADLQDPPEEIPRLIALANQGTDIVLAKRRSRKFSPWRNICAAIYFRLLNSFAQSTIDGSCATFSVLSRPVVEAYLTLNDSSRHYLFILFWLGFKRQSIEYEHGSRLHGESSYNFSKLVQHAMQGIYFQSNKLLELIVWLGLSLVGLSSLATAGLLVSCFLALTPSWMPFGASLFLIGGINLTALGLVGLYVGQTFEQVKGRPLYVIEQQTNLSNLLAAPSFSTTDSP